MARKNEWGVEATGEEDFSQWGWGTWDDIGLKISVAAAKLVMLEIKSNTMAGVEWKNDDLAVEFGLFEYETTLSVSLKNLVAQWIWCRTDTNQKLADEVEDAGAMADLFDALAAKLRKAMP